MFNIHLIPNAHLDPVWLWDWREGLNEGIATCYAAADLLEENPDVTFTRGEAFIYEHIERYHPDLFGRIIELVRQGRWEIVGGTMLQPDTNLGSGEAYVRQYLYGQRYFGSRFGVVPEVAYQVDSFGHAWGLPSIYHAVGCRYAILCRPTINEDYNRPRLFRWRGPDGSEILTVSLSEYCNNPRDFELTDGQGSLLDRALEIRPDGTEHWPLLIGLGDHGGGLNRKIVAQIHRLMENPPEGCVVRFSTLREFFTTIAPKSGECPVVDDELNFIFRGCYTSVPPIKRAYREAENLAGFAERLAAAADMMGKQEYPSALISQVWKDVLFNQFHDILPGSSIERACDEALNHLGRARHEALEVINNSVLPILLDIDTMIQEGVPVMLINPNASPFDGCVEIEWFPEYRPLSMYGAERVIKHICAIRADGTSAPAQLLPAECDLPLEWRLRGCFRVQVPACGYTTLWLSASDAAPVVDDPVEAGETSGKLFICNDRVHVECVAGESGVRIRDLATGSSWFSGPAGKGIVVEDEDDAWGAVGNTWTSADSWGEVLGEFKCVSARILQRGPLIASMLLVSEYGRSRLTQEFALYSGSSRIQCSARLEWNEPRALMQIEFPVSVTNPEGIYSGPYCVTRRRTDIGEVPANMWAAVDGDGFPVGVGGTGQYGFNLRGSTLAMSVVRSALYASMRPGANDPDCERARMGIGLHRFSYVLAPAADIEPAVRELNMPVYATLGFPHKGTLPHTQSVIEVSPASIQLAAAKRAENGSGWILRLWETTGQPQIAKVLILGEHVGSASLNPWQIKTLRVTRDRGQWTITEERLTE